MMLMLMTKLMLMKVFVAAVAAVDVMTDNGVNDALMMDDVDEDSDDVHVMYDQHWLDFVNSNTYVEMYEDLAVQVQI